MQRLGVAVTYVFPLTTSLTRLGVLLLAFMDEVDLPDSELQFMQRVADQVAVAIENALQFGQVRAAEREVTRERDRSQLLLEVNNAVASHLGLKELVQSISASLRRVVPHDAAFLTLYDSDGARLRVQALDLQALDQAPFEEGVLISMDDTPEGQAITARQPVLLCPRVDLARFSSPWVRNAVEKGIKSGCVVPLTSHGRTLGALSVASLQEAAFTEADAALLEQCSSQIAIAVENALAYREIADLKDRLAQEKLYLEDEIRSETNFEEIIGESAALKAVLSRVQTVATSDSTVLILGETGTGKELIARAIHEVSRRKGRTFVKLNCAAIPTGLLESELFGHERGAFTGAIAQKIGRMELANGGTLFLDEVGDIPLELQPKLLRALQEREFERLGSVRTQKSDVRFLAATNQNLPKMVAEKQFRSDLFYRLNVFPITIPALRERREDIPRLVRYFVSKYAKKTDKQIETIPTAAMTKLQMWPWPGNVRELENFIERSVILTTGSVLHVSLAELQSGDASEAPPATLRDTERERILQVLRDTRGVLAGPTGAAARLGVKRTTLQYKMKKLGITRDAF
jgi:formate hydrogenlyase transcriptional activator